MEGLPIMSNTYFPVKTETYGIVYLARLKMTENTTTAEHAIAKGDLKLLRQIRMQHPLLQLGAVACAIASRHGHLHIIQWLLSSNPPCEWDETMYSEAAEHGHLEVLQWLQHWNLNLPENLKVRNQMRVCYYAAKGGQLEILKWARSCNPPFPWNHRVCFIAASNGHLEVLQWLRAQDPPCEWNTSVCSEAADGDHLKVIQWARSQDPPCPWNEWTCHVATLGGRTHILEWLRSQDPPCPWDYRCIIVNFGWQLSASLPWMICCDRDELPKQILGFSGYSDAIRPLHSMLVVGILESIHLTRVGDVVPKDIVLLIGSYIDVQSLMFDRDAKLIVLDTIASSYRTTCTQRPVLGRWIKLMQQLLRG